MRRRLLLLAVCAIAILLAACIYISFQETRDVESRMDELAALLPNGLTPETEFCHDRPGCEQRTTIRRVLVVFGAKVQNGVLCDRYGAPFWFEWVGGRGVPLSKKQIEEDKEKEERLKLKSRDHRVVKMYRVRRAE
jgi:hypothetical protein